MKVAGCPLKRDVTPAQLRQLFDYDPSTGVFTHLTYRGRKGGRTEIGSIAGYVNPLGYRLIGIRGRGYMAHRLAWLYVYGRWPNRFIDHVNGKPDDNRIENLREADYKENGENRKLNRTNTSGHRGVSWDRDRQRWVATVIHRRLTYFAGSFEDKSAAVAAVRALRDVLYTHHKTEHAAQ